MIPKNGNTKYKQNQTKELELNGEKGSFFEVKYVHVSVQWTLLFKSSDRIFFMPRRLHG